MGSMRNHSTSLWLVSVVDDERSVRRGLSNLLKSAGYTTICFESAEAFLDFDRVAEVGCLVLDVKLKGIDGFELQERLVDSGMDVPIVFVSGHGDKEMQNRAMRAGAIAFLRKPIDVDALLTYIQRALASRREIP